MTPRPQGLYTEALSAYYPSWNLPDLPGQLVSVVVVSNATLGTPAPFSLPGVLRYLHSASPPHRFPGWYKVVRPTASHYWRTCSVVFREEVSLCCPPSWHGETVTLGDLISHMTQWLRPRQGHESFGKELALHVERQFPYYFDHRHRTGRPTCPEYAAKFPRCPDQTHPNSGPLSPPIGCSQCGDTQLNGG